jgi:hypothetical protein
MAFQVDSGKCAATGRAGENRREGDCKGREGKGREGKGRVKGK